MTTGSDASPDDLHGAALAVLRRLTGRATAVFREDQYDAIAALVTDRRRALVVQRTGWGKSAVYFVATALLRAAGSGPTLLVSPLLALMRDQVAAAARAGVRAAEISTSNVTEWEAVAEALRRDEIDVLLVSPERLTNPRFAAEQLPDLVRRCGLLVVDEAHCVSDWGHDFRPDYRRIRDLLLQLPDGTPVLATTATANARVVRDVEEQLGAGGVPVTTVRGPLARTSLRLGVLTLATDEQRLAWLVAHLGELPGSGIVYTLTVSAAEDTARLLNDAGYAVRAYTGRTDDADRRSAEEALRGNEVKALVATSALGMGFDKPDLGFIVHLGAPSSPVSYYQQVGRAGRAIETADVLLLPGAEDRDLWHWFASAAMPREKDAAAVLTALRASPGGMSTQALETVVDVRRSRLELLLKVLAVDGAVLRVSGGWTTTGEAWHYDAERYERVGATRTAEQQAMVAYERGEECRMAFLQRALDDPTAAACGRCDVCRGAWYPADVPRVARDRAAQQLQRVGVVLEPRGQWPTGLARLGIDARGRIPAGEQSLPGRAVARLTDLGWGQRLRTLLADDPDNDFADDPSRASQELPGGSGDVIGGRKRNYPPGGSEERRRLARAARHDIAGEPLLQACVAVLADWDWQQRPAAVVAVPSRRRGRLVDAVATRLATLGRLPYLGSLEPINGGPVGRSGGNSAFRLGGVWDRFGVPTAMAASLAGVSGPVLLVDDIADSRWTLTVAGRTLRAAGAPGVLPFALALAA